MDTARPAGMRRVKQGRPRIRCTNRSPRVTNTDEEQRPNQRMERQRPDYPGHNELVPHQTNNNQPIKITDAHFKAGVDLAWKKLNRYYTLSDETAACRAAIALHPSYKIAGLKRSSVASILRGIDQAKEGTEALFKDCNRRPCYEVMAPVAKHFQEMSDFRQ